MDSRADRPAVVSVQSRECGHGVLERVTGATLFPERLAGASIVEVVRRGGGALLYVTAPAMLDADEQVDYFLGLLPESREGELVECRKRVLIGGLPDDSTRWLSEKLLDDEAPASDLRADIRAFVDRERHAGASVRLSYFEPSGNLERFARDLELVPDQAGARHIELGTKAAGRALFERAGIPVPAGTPECRTLGDLAEEIAGLVRRGHRRVLVKLSSTEYGAGMGNAFLDLDGVPAGDHAVLVRTILDRLPGADLVDRKITWSDFVAALPKSGVIAEELVEGDEVRSPSFQGRLDHGDAVVVSTHEQVLSATGQTYLGSTFPADEAYRRLIVDHGLRVGRELAAAGVHTGDYGVDFIATRSGTTWRIVGCELNLRATGTKHGFLMATHLLGVNPDPDGRLMVNGKERVYRASDNIQDPNFVGLRPRQLITAIRASPLHYDPERQIGTVLHMLSAVHTFGKFGAVCIAPTQAEAEKQMADLRTLIEQLVQSGD